MVFDGFSAELLGRNEWELKGSGGTFDQRLNGVVLTRSAPKVLLEMEAPGFMGSGKND